MPNRIIKGTFSSYDSRSVEDIAMQDFRAFISQKTHKRTPKIEKRKWNLYFNFLLIVAQIAEVVEMPAMSPIENAILGTDDNQEIVMTTEEEAILRDILSTTLLDLIMDEQEQLPFEEIDL